MCMITRKFYLYVSFASLILINICSINVSYSAEIKDRVVAIVNDGVILESELIEDV